MAYAAKKTEHAGAKNGRGFWGHRAEAKKASKHRRRENDKHLARDQERLGKRTYKPTA